MGNILNIDSENKMLLIADKMLANELLSGVERTVIKNKEVWSSERKFENKAYFAELVYQYKLNKFNNRSEFGNKKILSIRSFSMKYAEDRVLAKVKLQILDETTVNTDDQNHFIHIKC